MTRMGALRRPLFAFLPIICYTILGLSLPPIRKARGIFSFTLFPEGNVSMYPALYLLWLLLNGRLTPEILLTGLVLTALIGLLIYKLFDYSPAKNLRVLKKLPLLLAYFFVLLCEILKANLSVISFILSSHRKIRPALVSFTPEIRSPFGRFLLANSITLTPGTITVDVTDGVFTVHCLKADLLDVSEQNIFVRLIRRLEA